MAERHLTPPKVQKLIDRPSNPLKLLASRDDRHEITEPSRNTTLNNKKNV